jgi:hypothetical protein
MAVLDLSVEDWLKIVLHAQTRHQRHQDQRACPENRAYASRSGKSASQIRKHRRSMRLVVML